MKNIIYIFGCIWILNSCAHNVPPAFVPPAPQKTTSAIPSARKVGSGVNTSIDTNASLGAKLGNQRQTITDQRSAISSAIAQAENIKQKALAKLAISEQESQQLVEELKLVEGRNTSLETQNADLIKLTGEQDKTLKAIRDELIITQDLIAKKESEAQQLQDQNKYFAESLTTTNKAMEKLKADLTKEKEKAARANVYRNWIIGLSLGFILWTIIKNLLMLYLPTTKFRI